MNTGSMSEKTRIDVLVVGGGASGMMAALQAARAGARVLLLEKNEKLGKKIYITGKGRCNVTNIAERDEFLRQVPRNPRFLYAALSGFDNRDMVELLAGLGCETKEERGGRVFPVSDHASDVTRALSRGLNEAGAQVQLNTGVSGIRPAGSGFEVSLTEGGSLFAGTVIIATGGISYPSTGSTGDGYRFARENGHAVTPLRGALVGLSSQEKWPMLLQGLSLKNVRVSCKVGKKMIYDELGEMLFTHFGFSGPLFIELSSHLPEDISQADIRLDMKPGMTPEEVDARLIRELADNPKRQISSMLQTLMPVRMAAVFAKLCGLDPDAPASSVNRVQRRAIADNLKAMRIPADGLRPVDEAIVTRGGVDVKGVNASTMMSRVTPGLFFAGEVLDVDAHTGGFNLQIAFSTGALAGRSAATYAAEQEDFHAER